MRKLPDDIPPTPFRQRAFHPLGADIGYEKEIGSVVGMPGFEGLLEYFLLGHFMHHLQNGE
jgi:hypothetical protein